MIPELEFALEEEVAPVDVAAAWHGARQIQREVGLHRLFQLVIFRVLREVRSGQVGSGQGRAGQVRAGLVGTGSIIFQAELFW